MSITSDLLTQTSARTCFRAYCSIRFWIDAKRFTSFQRFVLDTQTVQAYITNGKIYIWREEGCMVYTWKISWGGCFVGFYWIWGIQWGFLSVFRLLWYGYGLRIEIWSTTSGHCQLPACLLYAYYWTAEQLRHPSCQTPQSGWKNNNINCMLINKFMAYNENDIVQHMCRTRYGWIVQV